MRNILFPFLIISALTACGTKPSDIIDVDTQKAGRHKIKELYLFENAEVVPLSIWNDEVLSLEQYEIEGDVVLLMNASGDRIFVFSVINGEFRFAIDVPGKITDFTVSESFIDILTGKDIINFSLKTGAIVKVVHLRTGINLTSIARRDSDCVILAGYDGTSDYVGEYYFKNNRLFIIPNPNPISEGNAEEVIKNSRFFYYNNIPYYLYSNTGDIWKYAMFFSPQYRWKFDFRPEQFSNAQMTDEKVYLSFVLKGEHNTLIFDKTSKKLIIASKKTLGKEFPIGVLYDNIDYFVCQKCDIRKYAGSLSEIDGYGESNPILLKYSLR